MCFGKNSNCPIKFKLIVYDAVVRAKLVYGLDCVYVPEAAMNKLNAFQLRGLRKILKMSSTFIDRSNTNKKVFENANRLRHPAGRQLGPVQIRQTHSKQIQPFRQYIHNKQTALLGHTIRASKRDPMRTSSLKPNANTPNTFLKHCVGRPRLHSIRHIYE